MPIDPATGLAIAGAVGNTLLNNYQQGQDINAQNQFNLNQSKQQRDWNERMMYTQYNMQEMMQKRWWDVQTQYNSPQAQMARFKEAGLNPHLIYGQSNTSSPQSISTPDPKPYTKAEASSHVRGNQMFADFTRFQNTQAQTDNVKAQTDLAEANALLTAQKTANEIISGKRQTLDYGIAEALKDTQIEAAHTNLEKSQQDIRKQELDIEYAEKTMSPRVKYMYQSLQNAIKDGNLKEMDGQLKSWEIELNKMNLTKGDNVFLRMLKLFIDNIGNSFNLNPFSN